MSEPKAGTPPAKSNGALWRAWHVVGSYPVAVVLLLVLFVLTLAGTLAQRSQSLYDVQQRYFDSLIAVVDVGPISIPLPGGALTLALLGLNLIVGGLIRIRKRRATVGVIIGHVGIVVLFAGSLVESVASEKGQMTLYEPGYPGVPPGSDRSDKFQSFYEWELSVAARHGDERVEYVIPWSRLEGLGHRTLHATAKDLPFEIRVAGWTRNAAVERARTPLDGVHGWTLKALEPAKEAEKNFPGARVTLAPRGAAEVSSIVWGFLDEPWTVDLQGTTYEVDLRHRRWTVPFTLR